MRVRAGRRELDRRCCRRTVRHIGWSTRRHRENHWECLHHTALQKSWRPRRDVVRRGSWNKKPDRIISGWSLSMQESESSNTGQSSVRESHAMVLSINICFRFLSGCACQAGEQTRGAQHVKHITLSLEAFSLRLSHLIQDLQDYTLFCQITIRDTDNATARCEMVNDPHIATFDSGAAGMFSTQAARSL